MVGREVFPVFTDHLTAIRKKNLAKAVPVVKEAEINLMPRDDQAIENRHRGPVIIDYNENMEVNQPGNRCNGLLYTAPYEVHVPLRNSVTTNQRSLAQTVYGGKVPHKLIGSKAHRPGSVGIRYRNPKSYVKKSGDMTQKFSLRSELARARPQSGMIGSLQHNPGATMDRYAGADYYMRMYGPLEVEKYAIKHTSKGLGDKRYVQPAPKGDENPRKKKVIEHGVLKRYDTEYKMGYLEPQQQKQYDHFAGKPYKKQDFGPL